MLLEAGLDVRINDISQYLRECGCDQHIASKIQDMHQIVKGTLNTQFGWKEDWLRRELFENPPSAN